jgi:hypothetical protein
MSAIAASLNLIGLYRPTSIFVTVTQPSVNAVRFGEDKMP